MVPGNYGGDWRVARSVALNVLTSAIPQVRSDESSCVRVELSMIKEPAMGLLSVLNILGTGSAIASTSISLLTDIMGLFGMS